MPPFDRPWVHAYRAVVAVTPTTDVLVCGHERPRVDQSPAGAMLADVGAPRFARTRLCAVCVTVPAPAALGKVAHDDTLASRQIAADWGRMTRTERDQAAVILNALPDAEPVDLDRWRVMTPEDRAQLALRGEAFAVRLGLTFREYLGLRDEPAPNVTPAGLRRLQATPEEKWDRAQARGRRLLSAERERKR